MLGAHSMDGLVVFPVARLTRAVIHFVICVGRRLVDARLPLKFPHNVVEQLYFAEALRLLERSILPGFRLA